MNIIFFFLLPIFLFAQTGDDELVNPKDLIYDIMIDLKYSTPDHSFYNIPDRGDIQLPKFYTCNECLMVLELANALKIVQDTLRNIRNFNGQEYPEGIGIKIWDGYRPRAVQYLFWEIFPNPVYIADPNSGSMHNRAGAVDLTLIDLSTGEELEMPTEFDDFSTTASHSYSDLPAHVKNNRELLKSVMTDIGGLRLYSAEWWHYNLSGAGSFPLSDYQMK
ncbi:M15 family metallopeptidase [Bacteroidota bacterium]